MKIYKFKEITDSLDTNEFALGENSGLKLTYRKVKSGEKTDKLHFNGGQDAIFFMEKGVLQIDDGKTNFLITKGEAFQIKDMNLKIENPSQDESIYLLIENNKEISGSAEIKEEADLSQ